MYPMALLLGIIQYIISMEASLYISAKKQCILNLKSGMSCERLCCLKIFLTPRQKLNAHYVKLNAIVLT